MGDSYEREIAREQPAPAEPVRTPGRPTAPQRTYYREVNSGSRAILAVWWLVGLVDALIGIRFLLRLFGANPVPFVRFIYDVTWPLVQPFHGIFNTNQVGQTVVEPESLVAIVIYTLLGWGVVSLIRVLSRPSSRTTVVD